MSNSILVTNTINTNNIICNDTLSIFSHHKIVFDTDNLLINDTHFNKYISNVTRREEKGAHH